MVENLIIDADICIKLGYSNKYPFLCNILPLVAHNIYMHTWVRSEVKSPPSAVNQLNQLIKNGQVKLVNERDLSEENRVIFDNTYQILGNVMFNPHKPNKNRGEAYSLAYAKATGISYFATDESDLQQIIDSQLNTGMDNISCIRIIDIIQQAHGGKIKIPRKDCKALWAISGKKKEIFDEKIWPI